MEMDVFGTGNGTGRVSKQGNGVMGRSVWETRMRMDQLKGGIKVFGMVEREEEEKASNIFNHRETRDGGEEEDTGVAADSSKIPLKRIGVSGGRRRKWKPQPGTFEGPIQVISEKPERHERSPTEVTKSRSESTDGPVKMEPAESRTGKLEFLQRAGQKLGNGAGSMDPMDISDSGSWKQFSGSPGKVAVIHSKKKLTTKSHNDRPKKSLNQAGQFRNGPQVLGLNDGVNDEEEEEFFDIKEVSIAEQKPKTAVREENMVCVRLFSEKPTKAISDPVIKQQPSPPPVSKHSAVHQSYAKDFSNGSKHDAMGQNIVHNLSGLVMWRCIPKSAMVFGLGTLIMISSSYMTDADICFISAISYLGLACLSATFLYRSIIWRGFVDIADTSFSELGEEEAHFLTKLVLPYLNDFLRQLRALIYGDPAITMKLAVVLFVLARCGSFVTMWNMIKLGFFIAFTVPKLWSLYSTQLAAQGQYWAQASRKTWDSCPHKEAVAAAVMILVLGFSSSITRIWAGFVLVVLFRCYQQSLVRNGCPKSDEGAEKKWSSQRQHSVHAFAEAKRAC